MKNKQILITGGTGLLGKSLIEKVNSQYEIIATYLGNYEMEDREGVVYKKLDIRDKEGYRKLFKDFKPDVVIHTVSVSSPDFAQKNREYTREVDIIGTKNIVYNCQKFNSKMIYISSNAIYKGNKAPYAEDDEARPINYYGKVKLAGERLTKDSKITYAIVRPILMYGWNHAFERSNIVTFALGKLVKGEVVNVYDDVFCNPILADFCAEAIWRIINNRAYGIYNIGGKDILSIYQLVKMASVIFGLDSNLVKPIQQGFFKELVRRPKNTSYLTNKMENILRLQPLSVKDGLEIMKAKVSSH